MSLHRRAQRWSLHLRDSCVARLGNPHLKPEVRYDGGGLRGHLEVQQPSGSFHGGHSKYRWDLRFNDEKPLDMEVHFGAGEGRLDLGSLSLRSLEVHLGVGELRVDLRGRPTHDYDVNIHGGSRRGDDLSS